MIVVPGELAETYVRLGASHGQLMQLAIAANAAQSIRCD